MIRTRTKSVILMRWTKLFLELLFGVRKDLRPGEKIVVREDSKPRIYGCDVIEDFRY